MRSLLGLAFLVAGCGGPTATQTPAPPPDNEKPSTAVLQPPSDSPPATVAEEKPPAPVTPPAPSLPDVTFAEVEGKSPPSKMPSIAIRSPQKNQVVAPAKALDLEVKLEARGWPVDGGDICVTLDARPCVRVDAAKAKLSLRELAGDGGVSEGQHVLVAHARHGNRETLKATGKSAPVAIVPFFVGKKGDARWKDGAPLLVFSTPTAAPDGSVLVDYYVANCEIADGKYVLHAMVTGPGMESGRGEVLTAWKPWKIDHARPGMYTVRLVLLHYEPAQMDSASATSVKYSAREVGGPFADVTRQIRVGTRE